MKLKAILCSGALVAVAVGALQLGCGGEAAVERDRGQWPQWRGPDGLAVSPFTELPFRWGSSGRKIRWRTPLGGEGNSSPVISHGKVFVTAARRAGGGNMQRVVYALALDTGKILWETVVVTSPREVRHQLSTFAVPTPATDGERLFVHFGQHLAALDLEGEILWSREVDPEFAEYSLYGAGSSPLLTADAVIISQDRETVDKPEGWMAAFSKRDGEERWRVSWDDTCCSYSTPLLLLREGREEVVLAKSGEVVSYDPRTGKENWSQELHINQPVPSPVAAGDLLAVFGGGNRVRSGSMLRLTGSGPDTRVELLWESRRIIPQTSSPVLYNGLLFTVSDTGALVCYDAESGRVYWTKRLGRGNYGPSLVAGDGKIYASTAEGRTTVVQASQRFRVLAVNDLQAGSNASPALVDGHVVLRSRDAVFCIRKGRAKGKPEAAAP